MNNLETIILLAIAGTIALFVLRELLGRELRRENRKLEKKLHRGKEMKKHLYGYDSRKKEIFEPTLSEEENESEGIPSSPVMDEEDSEEEDEE
jgi:hypothetical protein